MKTSDIIINLNQLKKFCDSKIKSSKWDSDIKMWEESKEALESALNIIIKGDSGNE